MNREFYNDKNQGELLPLMEEFYTIQGEGFHNGTAAYFVRLGGCDVGCHWCDVKESWDSRKHPIIPTKKIIANAMKYGKTVVVTGGEPLTWNMNSLTKGLKEKGLIVHLETSGSYKLTGIWDWICLSPKKRKLPSHEIYTNANELKIIVYNKTDLNFAEEQAVKVNPNCLLYLQPEWSRRERVMPLIVNYVMEHPEWRVSLQTHKYLNIP